MKMYILFHETVPVGFAVVAAAHASLACYLKFKDHPDVKSWLNGPFYKAVCSVNDTEFESARTLEDCVVLTESALDGRDVALAFRPRKDWPKAFRYFELFK